MDQASNPGVLPEDNQKITRQLGVGGPTIAQDEPAHQWPAGLHDVGATKCKVHAIKVLKAQGQAIATWIGPWVASSRTLGEKVHMYVDAAEWKSTYMVGVWSDKAGAGLWEALATVWNWQAAELSGVDKEVKMADYRGMKRLNLGVDNLAAFWAVLNK